MPLTRCRQVFGRDAELGLLRGAVAGVREGRGGFVLLTGPAGIGKSRLAAELLEEAERARVVAVLGRATASQYAVPFRPLTQALLQVVRTAGMPTGAEFAPWRAALAPVLGAAAGAVFTQDVTVRGEAVIQLLRRCAADGVLFVIEDVHWADPDTVALLDYLADGVANLPILWLVTARESAAVAELADRLRGRRAVTVLPLQPLSVGAVRQMVADCRPDADSELLEQVCRVAEGVPLFVEEIAAAAGVPDSFAHAVAGQLASCDEPTRRVVETAAVLGDPAHRMVAQVAGVDATALADARRRAVDAGLFVESRPGLRFRHVLTREAVLDALGERRREVAAAALAAAGSNADADAAWLAALAEQAGDRLRAGRLLAAAGARAAIEGALPTATETFARAVRLLTGSPESGAVRLRLVETLGLAGRVDDALAEGAVLLAGGPSPDAHLVLAEAAARGARWTLAEQHLSKAEPGPRRDLLTAEIAFAAGRIDEARSAARRVVVADPDLQCRALVLLGRIERLTDLGAAREAFERALGTARAARLPVRELDALHELGTIDLLDHAGTGRLLDARRVAERLGALGTRAVLDLQLTAAYLGRFETEPATRHATAAADIADRLGLAAVSAKARCGLAETRAQLLDEDGMERLLAAASAADPDDPFTPAFAWGQCRGMLALFGGDFAAALRCFERGIALLAEVTNPEPVEFRAFWPLLLATAGDPRAADELAAANSSELTITFANRGLLGYAAAVLAGASGDRSAAAEFALGADAYLARFPVWGHLARLCTADAPTAAGWGQPAAWLAAAEPALAGLGFDQLARRCRQAARAGAVTAREADVLALVREGLPNKEIADRLHLSARTVEKHVESLLRKTGSRTRTQLAVWAGRQDT